MISRIARKLGRAEATVKSYFYDPTGEKAKTVKRRYQGVSRLRRIHAGAQRQERPVRRRCAGTRATATRWTAAQPGTTYPLRTLRPRDQIRDTLISFKAASVPRDGIASDADHVGCAPAASRLKDRISGVPYRQGPRPAPPVVTSRFLPVRRRFPFEAYQDDPTRHDMEGSCDLTSAPPGNGMDSVQRALL